MIKLIGGVIIGVFLGALVIEILKHRRPELIQGIEKKAKEVTDRLFDNLREAYDFRKANA